MFGDRGIDDSALLALQRFKSPLLCVVSFELDSIDPKHLGINVLPGEVGIGLEHFGSDVAPHHQLDYAL